MHRLDKDTSGLLVAAKTERAMASLAKQFANHTIERAYNAVVWGAPRDGDGLIESQIGRSPFDRKRMAVLRAGGKTARTRYQRAGEIRPGRAALRQPDRMPAGNRAHPPDPGAPDPSGPSPDRRSGLWPRPPAAPRAKTPAEEAAFTAAAGFPRQALHAFVLGFQHPSLHKTLRFESPWPADFAGLVAALRGLNTG